jgi:hypothetical protein
MKGYFLMMVVILLSVLITMFATSCAHTTKWEYGNRYGVGESQPTRGCIDRGDCKVVNVADDAFDGKGVITNEDLQDYADRIVKSTPMPACAWNGNCGGSR